ncbi:hybrid sensor histidine kinase/response regulator [Spirulina sp. CS-785/01]|uniref:hybrid sensor histidine kinase/response regulator n=1 Tax=Spirulina sp. CS-785/01 TaxID=3021716 RepID=UPI002330D129|nr:hybrid sensor histidine kinase/response regulator [Spirulina sp. CS-785/01]MDB9312407.1 hybrid sensor histidine kinase/response regulator [Spirulina sp. CS-785/01]
MSYPQLFETSATKNRILVVDDSPDNLFLVQSILEEEGYESQVCESGQDAIALLETTPPHLLLLDVMMPGMDGFEVTQRIRNNPHLPYIPILLITAYDRASVVKGLDSGADDFIRKPVEVDELLARVRSLLRLKHSVDERDRIARQREDFVSRLTHDLRTPLIAADRMLELMQQEALGELSPEMAEVVGVMVRSNHNLLEMVNNLLAVYRYEAGRKTLNLSPVHLAQILREVIEELTPLAVDKGLILETEGLANDSIVEGDRLELRRVFANLIGNAIKFTKRGSITVRLLQQPQKILIQVEDTGQGISPEDQKQLFQPFRQGNHQQDGSGLGLHLSRCILEAHGGEISVQSKVGQGSLFQVTLNYS